MDKSKSIKVVETAVNGAVDKAVTLRWDAAKDRADRLRSHPDPVKHLRKSFSKELGATGFAAGATAAVPGAGLAVAAGASVADITIFTTRAADLILTIGALHGLEQASIEERRHWVLVVLAYGASASQFSNKVAQELGKGLGKKAATAVPAATLQAMNRAAGRTLVTKYGTKRGFLALGRAFPFGIGGVIGGGGNVIWVRVIARNADNFFKSVPEALGAES